MSLNEKEAYWIEKRAAGGGFWDYYFVCSECNHKTPVRGYTRAPDYCPGCGKKMTSKKYVYSFDGEAYTESELLDNIHTDEELERTATTLLMKFKKSEIIIGVEHCVNLLDVLDFDLGDLCIKHIRDNAEKLFGANVAREYLKNVKDVGTANLDKVLKMRLITWVHKKEYLESQFKYVEAYREFKR